MGQYPKFQYLFFSVNTNKIVTIVCDVWGLKKKLCGDWKH